MEPLFIHNKNYLIPAPVIVILGEGIRITGKRECFFFIHISIGRYLKEGHKKERRLSIAFGGVKYWTNNCDYSNNFDESDKLKLIGGRE